MSVFFHRPDSPEDRPFMFLKPSNAQLKFWSKLHMAKYRRQEGVFLAEGIKVVRELFRSPWKAEALLVLEGRESRWEEALGSIPTPTDTYLLTEKEWKAISQDKEPEGMMAQVSIPPPLKRENLRENTGHLLLAYAISNPNNLGSLLRTAHWFGIRDVIIGKDSVDMTHPKVIRSSMGSLFHLNILDDEDLSTLIPTLKTSRHIVGTDAATGIPPHPAEHPTAILVGNESHGLPGPIQSLVDECWRIPGDGDAESLSLPQAAAIMIYELTRGD